MIELIESKTKEQTKEKIKFGLKMDLKSILLLQKISSFLYANRLKLKFGNASKYSNTTNSILRMALKNLKEKIDDREIIKELILTTKEKYSKKYCFVNITGNTKIEIADTIHYIQNVIMEKKNILIFESDISDYAVRLLEKDIKRLYNYSF